MAFTGKLGTSDSYLGNIVLGSGGGTTGSNQNDSVTIAGNAAITPNPNLLLPLVISINGTSTATTLSGFRYLLSEQIDGLAAINENTGLGFAVTLTVAAIAGIDETISSGVPVSFTIAGVSSAAVDLVAFNGLLLTIAGQSSISESMELLISRGLSISGFAAFASPGGVVYFNNLPIEGFAATTILPGSGFPLTLSIDGTSDFSEIEQYIKELALEIDGISAIDLSVQYTANIVQIIAGNSSIAIVNTGDWQNSFTLAATGVVFIENIYDVLYVTATISSFSVALHLISGPSANPGGVAGFGVSSQCVFDRRVVQTLSLTQTVKKALGTAIIGQSLTFSQHASGRRVHSESIDLTLDLNQETEVWRPTNNGLVFSQSAQVTRVRSFAVVQSLGFSQTVFRNQVINRSVTQTLILNSPNIRTYQGRFTVQMPPAYSVLVTRRCLVVLGVPAQTVILPCPEFDDSLAFQGTLDLKRSMIGSTYTVVKNTAVQKIKYDFSLWTAKYLELRVFLLAHSSETMTLVNWKGETWLVTLANNPVQLTATERFQPRGERYTVTLEFDGIRIGGQT